MAISLFGLVIGNVLATNQGVSQEDAARIGLVGGLLGTTPIGVLVTSELARQAAPAAPTQTTRTGSGDGRATTSVTPRGGLVPVPDVIGESREDAIRDLADGQLRAAESRVRSTETEIDFVDSQSPKAGEVVRTGSTVNLFVSKGVRVPELVGLSEKSADDRLTRAGLVAKHRETPSSTIPEGEVAKQDPSPGADVNPGSDVEVFVSTGRGVEVPPLVGKKMDDARKAVEEVHLYLAEDEAVRTPQPQGVVVFQVPPPLTTVKEGEVVEVRVSLGPDGHGEQ
jgi:beta-lactam-binding protein with PASTA domain